MPIVINEVDASYTVDEATGDIVFTNPDGSTRTVRFDSQTGQYSTETAGISSSAGQFEQSLLFNTLGQVANNNTYVDTSILFAAAASGDSAMHSYLGNYASSLNTYSASINAGASQLEATGTLWQNLANGMQNNQSGLAQYLDASGQARLDQAYSSAQQAQAYAEVAARTGSQADLIAARYANAGALVDAAQLLYALNQGDTNGIAKATFGAAAGILIGMAATGLGAPLAIGIGIGILGSMAADWIYDEYFSDNFKNSGNFWENIFDSMGLNPNIGNEYDRARNWIRRVDPLVLDLDGDGIETIGADSSVLFDHDGDHISNSTGWIKGDDGILVLDRNGNGLIDNGSELFGDQTVGSALAPGEVTNRSAGLRALDNLDTNQDGRFDSTDVQYGAVRVWRDINQDGVSQSSELFTLAELGIAAINLDPTNTTDINLSNGNVIDSRGTFVRADGSLGALGDLLLANNNFHREFEDHIELTEQARNLPNLGGSGMVRDLAEAASLDNDLAEAVAELTSGMSRDEMKDRLDEILALWAETSEMETTSMQVVGAGATSISVFGNGGTQDLSAILSMLERFNGSQFFNRNADGSLSANGRTYSPVADPNAGGAYLFNITLGAEPTRLLLESYAQLRESVYAGLVLRTRLSGYLDAITVSIGQSGISLDASEMTAQLETLKDTDEVHAYQDLMDLMKYGQAITRDANWDGHAILQDWIASSRQSASGLEVLQQVGIVLFDGTTPLTDGEDIVAGTSGSDSIQARGGSDIVYGGGGNDALYGEAGDDILLGGSENDYLAGGTEDDRLEGEAGSDTLYGEAGNDMLLGGSEDDYLFGGIGNDRLDGGDGNDTLNGDGSDDELYGDAGNDTLNGGTGGSNRLYGGAGDDVLTLDLNGSSTGLNILAGGTGNDTLYGGGGADRYEFNLGDGQDTLVERFYYSGVTDVLAFGAGIAASDITVCRVGNDLVFRHANGTDAMRVKDQFSGTTWLPNSQVEKVVFADGTEWSMATLQAAGVTTQGGAADETLGGYTGKDIMRGGDGNDTLNGDGSDDELYGDAGNDTLNGGTGGSNRLYGGAGDDVLTLDLNGSSTGLNILAGGTGNDTLYGGGGADRYEFNLGDGQDTLVERFYYSGVTDVLAFGAGIAASDITVCRVGNDLVFRHANGTDAMRVKDQFSGTTWLPNSQVEKVVFADGTEWSMATLQAAGVTTQGGAADETLGGYTGKDIMRGGDGNDTLNGDGSDDELYGDAGNDTLNGGTGGSNRLYGGAGDDVLTLDLNGSSTGLNILAGGTGNDTLYGGGGADRYEFNLGDGQDTLVERFYYSGVTDVLAFGAGIAASDITVCRVGNDLVFRHANGTDAMRVKDQFSGTTWLPNSQVEKVVFADGTEWSMATLQAAGVTTQGGAADETLGGYTGKDIMRGGDGNDTLNGDGSDDELYGDAGNDTLNGGTGGSNRLYGGAGDDVLTLDLNGSSTGLNILAGGTGNDTLYGGGGADRYEFNLGDGQDTLVERFYYSGVTDVLAFGAGIAASDITVCRVGNDLVFRHANGTDAMRVKDQFSGTTWLPNSQVEKVVFADGTEWSMATLQAAGVTTQGGAADETLGGYTGKDIMRGGDGNDTLNGDGSDDELYGDAGNDTLNGGTGGSNRLYGGAGDDVLTLDLNGSSTGLNILAGGTGNDTLYGGGGADRYEFNLGDGQDTLVERFYYSGVTDVLAFGAGIAASDITVCRVGNDLVFRHANGTDAMRVKDQFSGTTWLPNSQVEKVVFADGTEWSMATLQAAGVTTQGGAADETLGGYTGKDIMRGGDGNDTLNGDGSDDELYGDAGNDTLNGGTGGSNRLYGGAGDDVLTLDLNGSSTGLNILAGGTGNDTLYGGGGADRYEFNLGDGQDTLVERFYYSGVTDVLAFGAGIAASDITVCRVGNDLVFRHANGTDAMRVKDQFSGTTWLPNSQVEKVVFADGTEWSMATLQAAGVTTQGGAADETLGGYTGKDIMRGGDGNDTLNGDGSDDELYGDAGNDTLNGGTGGSNRLYGGAGDDVLTLDLNGSSTGLNILAGGTGNDTLYGGGGADRYEFNLGDGQDTLVERFYYSGVTDVLAFGAGIDSDELWLERTGNDLLIGVLGTNDSVTVKDWYSSSSNQLEKIMLSDGKTLTASEANALVSAMASYAKPSQEYSSIPESYRPTLMPQITANW